MKQSKEYITSEVEIKKINFILFFSSKSEQVDYKF